MRFLGLVALLFSLGGVALGQDAVEELKEIIEDAPPLAPAPPPAEKRQENLFGTLNDQQLLLVGLRLDTAYSAGGTVTQGFSLPSVRLTAWGHAGDLISYRFSLGQAREFTSVLLPTLLPVQAYVDFNSSSALDWDPKSKLTFRFGLFTPTFNPWWSPDLAEIPLPDYHESHRSLFLNRDLGAELQFEPIANRLLVHFGVFNGSGIFTQNTNNSRAVTGGIQGTLYLGSAKWVIGLSGFLRDQAENGNVNYRSDFIGNFFTSLEVPYTGFRLTGEVFGGMLNDSTRTAYPIGAAGTLTLPTFSGLRLFARGEVLRNSGTGTGYIRNAQFGPILDLHKSTQAYVFYQYYDNNGSIENVGWIRIRLML